jgi:hypothetical protein
LNSSKALKSSLFWLSLLLAMLVSNFFYQTTYPLIFVGAALALGLSGLTIWSGSRISGSVVPVKLMVVAGVAAFMYAQALDVAYSLAFAPMGNRFDMPIEVLVFGLLFWVFAIIARTFVFRPQQQK